MTRARLTAVMMALGLGLSACASVDTATRNIPLEQITTETAAPAPSFQLVGYDVSVPTTLKVSEANSYYPGGDIVWRGDAFGNRYEQVGAIFENAIEIGARPLEGALPVVVEIEVKRFHALTEKTRYSVGGIHSIEFVMTIRDPLTGAVVRGPREIKADLVGYGGSKALQAEARGLTQKYRITQHLAKVVRDEMSLATGWVKPQGGVTARIQPLSPVQAL
ncbi:hypothetical protein NBRC116590_27330 [Pelagimonas sp. KU-00592-HH]|uniref:DUF6778 family protein n=1 Tax=Roseobacteraceae TaxID=2854170 RepID=UPI0020CC0A29|nr:DUF6778 family protein [Shimia sp. CNT1-13L.2]MCP9481945.1 hypothetical protein [Shimia sp. CNT1-13L.2]